MRLMREIRFFAALGILIGLGCFGCGSNVPDRAIPGVKRDDIGLNSEVVFSDHSVGRVADIALGDYDPAPGEEIVIAGDEGAVITDSEFQVIRSIDFPEIMTADPSACDEAECLEIGMVPTIVDFESDGIPEYVSLNRRNFVAYDSDGQVLWRRDEVGSFFQDLGVYDYAYLLGDGRLFFLAQTDPAALVLDHEGQVILEIPEDSVYDVFFNDTNDDGVFEVVMHRILPFGNERLTYDITGTMLSIESCPTCAVPGGRRTRFPDRAGLLHLIFIDGDGFNAKPGVIGEGIFDNLGGLVYAFDPPEPVGGLGSGHRARRVLFDPSQPPYVALNYHSAYREFFAGSSSHIEMTIFADDGILRYQETLSTSEFSAMVAVPGADGRQDLLVGGNGRVLRYTLNHSDRPG